MILQLQRQAEEIFVHNLVAEYIVRLVLATRTPAEFNLPDLTSVIQIGCSLAPRLASLPPHAPWR